MRVFTRQDISRHGESASPPLPHAVAPATGRAQADANGGQQESMPIDGPAKRLRIYVGEADTSHGQPLAHAIVLRARAAGLAGATVAKGIGGYGAHRVLHDAGLIEVEGNLPLIVELVDRADRIEAFLPVVAGMVREGMVTIEDVQVVAYRPRNGALPGDGAGGQTEPAGDAARR
jgi:PII-like signaling protein